MSTNVIELVTYKLKADADLSQLRDTHEEVNAWLLQQPGFLYRSLSQDEQSTWFDIVYWENMETAKAAGEAFMSAPAGQALMTVCDMDSCFMRHMTVETAQPGENI